MFEKRQHRLPCKVATALLLFTTLAGVSGCNRLEGNSAAPPGNGTAARMAPATNSAANMAAPGGNHVLTANDTTGNVTAGNVTTGNQTVGTAADRPVLESLQFVDNALIVTTTHTNIQSILDNPHVEAGNPAHFVFGLHRALPGKYPLNQTIVTDSQWAKQMVIRQTGDELVFDITLKPGYSKVSTAIGAGDMIQFTLS
ncbi:MAG: hypothetical protein IRZ10_04750 [Thermoflavifilum sp.]|nr:hypothetical protein [Thermoflavifilum sp.]MCL6513707.1 hypothetical protein [Alicyclobacillus sp.]